MSKEKAMPEKKKKWKRLLSERAVYSMLLYSLLLSPLFFYIWLFDRPELPLFGVIIPLYVIWIVSMIMDMRITLSIKSLIVLYESNIIFRNLYQKYRPLAAVLIQLFIEISFVMLVPSLIFPRQFGVSLYFDYQSSAILAGIIAIIHFMAYHSNRKTIAAIQLQNKEEK